MAEQALRLADDKESYCRVVDPASGPVKMALVELTSEGALLDQKLTFGENDYIDATLQLKELQSRPMFAQVIGIQGEQLLVRWLHFDPSDQVKLAELLERFRTGTLLPSDKSAPPPPRDPSGPQRIVEPTKEGTRRIVRPSTVYTPFAAKPAGASPAIVKQAASPPGTADKPPASKDTQRSGTRRIVRPTAATLETSPPPDGAKAPVGAKHNITPDSADSAKHPVQVQPVREDSASQPVLLDQSGSNRVLADTATPSNPQSTEIPGDRSKVVVGADGKMDIGATIRSKAKTIKASDLAARHDNVRVLNMGTIKLLIQDAVSEAMQHLTANMGESEKKQLLVEAEAQFQERLKAFKAEKESSDAYAKHLNDQLRKAQELLEQERKREIKAEQFTVSEKGMGQIEDKMARVLEHAMRTGNVSPELEAKLRQMISHILDEERERIRKQEEEAQSAKIDLLEKKIHRLAKDLDETERERDEARELATALEQQGGGLRGVLAAGIKDGDGNKKRKLALMKEILDINRRIREELGVTYERDDQAVAKLDAEREKMPDSPPPSAKVDAKEAPVADDTAQDEEGAVESAEPEIDPDDMAWEVKDIAVMSDEERDAKKAGGVKKIASGAAAPPPLARKPGGG